MKSRFKLVQVLLLAILALSYNICPGEDMSIVTSNKNCAEKLINVCFLLNNLARQILC